jgi:hypothetical protein
MLADNTTDKPQRFDSWPHSSDQVNNTFFIYALGNGLHCLRFPIIKGGLYTCTQLIVGVGSASLLLRVSLLCLLSFTLIPTKPRSYVMNLDKSSMETRTYTVPIAPSYLSGFGAAGCSIASFLLEKEPVVLPNTSEGTEGSKCFSPTLQRGQRRTIASKLLQHGLCHKTKDPHFIYINKARVGSPCSSEKGSSCRVNRLRLLYEIKTRSSILLLRLTASVRESHYLCDLVSLLASKHRGKMMQFAVLAGVLNSDVQWEGRAGDKRMS